MHRTFLLVNFPIQPVRTAKRIPEASARFPMNMSVAFEVEFLGWSLTLLRGPCQRAPSPEVNVRFYTVVLATASDSNPAGLIHCI